ncbi:MAG: branched-chain amino acid ABC transporter permease [Reyranella sp.]|nr:MAG: branched-chain amino acid ABC transporter permease [Reyranella sp.]
MSFRLLLIAVLIVAACVIPQFLSRSTVDLLVFTCIYAIAGLGVGLLLGECGIANLGQTVFYGIGAYSSAYVTVSLGGPSLGGFALGVALSAMLALAVGWPVLRLTGYFLALATLALGIIANALFYEWDWLTGGDLGIGGIPRLRILGYDLDTPLRFYYLALATMLLCLLLARNMVTSRSGLMLRATRDEADAASSLAINLQWLRTRVFVLSAVLGSIAGSLFAHYGAFVNVQSFGITKAIAFLLIPALGGVHSLPGVIVGALFITFLPELLSSFGQMHQILFGLALVGVVVAMPSGLVGGFRSVWQRLTLRVKGH